MRKVYLIRHGTTEANEKRLYYGFSDVSLSERGRAELSGLKAKGGYPDISGCTVYISGMTRTRETLELLFPNTEYSVEENLREMNFGKFEMHSYEELRDDEEYQAWISGDYMSNVCPGGESGNMQCERAIKAFRDILRKTQGDLLIISHSGTMTAIMQELFPNIGENRWHWQCSGGTGYSVELDGDKAVNYYRIPYDNAEK